MDKLKIKQYKNMSLLDIAEIYHFDLEPIGDKHRGLCLFHNDQGTPNFFAYADDSFFCYACRRGGDKAQFIAEAEHISRRSIIDLWEGTTKLSDLLSIKLKTRKTNYLNNFKILLANVYHKHNKKLSLHFLAKYDTLLSTQSFMTHEQYSSMVKSLVKDIGGIEK